MEEMLEVIKDVPQERISQRTAQQRVDMTMSPLTPLERKELRMLRELLGVGAKPPSRAVQKYRFFFFCLLLTCAGLRVQQSAPFVVSYTWASHLGDREREK